MSTTTSDAAASENGKSAMPASGSAAWPTMTVAELREHNPAQDASDDLTRDIAENGPIDPLLVIRDDAGRPIVHEGRSRLTACERTGLKRVPVTNRPVIRISLLTPHPKNARESLRLTDEFRDSILTEGVLTPIQIQRLGDGTIQINKGHRRYYQGRDIGLTHLPYVWEERDEASVLLDMITTADEVEGLNEREKAATLFEARELKAPWARLARVAKTTQKNVKTMVQVGGSKVAQQAGDGWDLSSLSLLSELEEQDPEQAEEIAKKYEHDPRSGVFEISYALTEIASARQAEEHRAELEAAEARLRTLEELSDKARALYELSGVDEEEHAKQCQGHVWVLEPGEDHYEPYCSNAYLHGHLTEEETQAGQQTVGGTAGGSERAQGIAQAKAGNKKWETASGLRLDWYKELLAEPSKATLTKLDTIVTDAMLTGDSILGGRLDDPNATRVLAQLLGMPGETSRREITKKVGKSAKRQTVARFATLTAAYETRLTKAAWRTGSQRDDSYRSPAGRWLRLLRDELGRELYPIEAAVADGEEYTPETG